MTDPHHRLWLPGRKWMAQRTLSRTVPALLPTPSASDATGAELETREARKLTGGGGASLRDLPRLIGPGVDADAERVAGTEAGELPAGPGTGEEPGAPGQAREAEHGATGRLGGGGRLLPTPTAGDGDASGSRNLEASKAHPGVSLTDAVQTGGSTQPRRLLPTPTAADDNRMLDHKHAGGNHTLQSAVYEETATPRLLPTPQAADGDGGRQEKTAMGSGGVRPSGAKATLPLPTAVAMRDELTDTPFAQADGDDEQLVLLPTPRVTSERNSRRTMVENEQWSSVSLAQATEIAQGILPREFASWDEVPGELGRDARRRLLPTPMANDENPGAGGELRAALVHGEGRRNETGIDTFGRPNDGRPSRALPTPTSRDWKGPNQRGDDSCLTGALDLLPTPQAADGDRTSEQNRRHYSEGADNPTLLGAARRSEIVWGVYEAAVRRWETVLEREAPLPTDEKGRLAPEFVEWMLGYPEGWFDVEGVSRTRMLRALGNSVQVQCGEAVGGWFAMLLETGLLG